MQNKETKKTALVRRQKSAWPFVVIASLLVVAIGLVGYVLFRSFNTTEFVSASIGNKEFKLEVARVDADREKGLSERDGVAENSGMLFIFDAPGDWRMWMVQMRFPIDIAWLDSGKKIIKIKHNATPAEYPEVYKADTPSLYVVEVPAGTFNTLGVREGDSIEFISKPAF